MIPVQQIKKTRANAGETLVEVVASIFIFLILIGILQGAISYSSNALSENKKIRKENAKVIEALQSAGTTSVKNGENIAFRATNANMTVLGSQVFTTKTDLAKKVVNYQGSDGSGKQITFYLYQSPETSKGPATDQSSSDGGDTP